MALCDTGHGWIHLHNVLGETRLTLVQRMEVDKWTN